MKRKNIENVCISGYGDLPASLYVLKHKDLDVAMVQIDSISGKIDYILDIYLPEELPIGCGEDGSGVIEWWESRAIPDSRRGIQQVLNYLNEKSNLSLMLSAYGLSLTDHYWMQPIGEELNGEMKKKWVIQDGIRYLMKVNANDYGQQAVNEVIASRMHERLGWENHVSYKMDKAIVDGVEIPCSLNPLFTSDKLEFVSAYQLVKNIKTPNNLSNYELIIQQAVLYGLEEAEVRRHLEYTIVTDFIMTNTDRHFNNFGFLYDNVQHKLISMAPIFDTGNALFYNCEIIPAGNVLLDVVVSSFKKKEVAMLEYVQDKGFVDLDKLNGFAVEAESLLKEYTDMPLERAERIAQTISQKIEYLRLFQQGKKIWKKEKYW